MGIARLKVDLVADGAFGGNEWLVLLGAADVSGAFFFVLIEPFPVGAMALGGEPMANIIRKVMAAGGDDPAIGKGFQKDFRQAIAVAIDQSQGIGVRAEDSGALLNRLGEE